MILDIRPSGSFEARNEISGRACKDVNKPNMAYILHLCISTEFQTTGLSRWIGLQDVYMIFASVYLLVTMDVPRGRIRPHEKNTRSLRLHFGVERTLRVSANAKPGLLYGTGKRSVALQPICSGTNRVSAYNL
jgi:hypothetical protein